MRKLLWTGPIAAVLFMTVLLIAGATRPDFHPMRHPGSSLALGPGGWVQSANFVVAGLLTLAFAFSLGTRKAWTIGIWALGLIGAGIFVADPVSGYPAGTPPIPASPSFSGRTHDLVSLAGFVAMAVAFFVFARGRGPVWASYSILSAVVFLGSMWLATQGFAQIEPWVEVAGLLQRVAVLTAWAWLGALGLQMIRLDGSREPIG